MKHPIVATTLLLALIAAPAAWAHAFPDHSSPQVGATLAAAPTQVRIWFNGKLEPVFSTLIVKNAKGEQVSIGKGKVDAKNDALLATTLPAALPAGTYTVDWSVVSRDGHHTAGHFDFSVK